MFQEGINIKSNPYQKPSHGLIVSAVMNLHNLNACLTQFPDPVGNFYTLTWIRFQDKIMATVS